MKKQNLVLLFLSLGIIISLELKSQDILTTPDVTSVGTEAGIGGLYSSYFGRFAGASITNGERNTFIGHQSGASTTSGNYLTYIGAHAGQMNQLGNNNTYLGFGAGQTSSGNENLFLGFQAGQNSGGNRNVFIGYRAGRNESGDNKLYISNNGSSTPLIYGDFGSKQLGINTTVIDGYTLAVKGKIITEEVRVQLYTHWPDYVFEPNYDLMPIAELKEYVTTHKHLPDVPSAKELAEEKGVDVGEMNILLLKKVEELSLYIIELEERIKKIENK